MLKIHSYKNRCHTHTNIKFRRKNEVDRMAGRIKYNKETINNALSKSSNQMLELRSIDRTRKSTSIGLFCTYHEEEFSIFSNAFHKKTKEKELLCKQCKLNEKRKDAFQEFVQNGVMPIDMSDWHERKSLVKCKNEDGLHVNTSLTYLSSKTKRNRPTPFIPELAFENLARLCYLLELKLLDQEYEGYDESYLAETEDGYVVVVRISSMLKVLRGEVERDHYFNIFYKTNPYVLENVRLWLKKRGYLLLDEHFDGNNSTINIQHIDTGYKALTSISHLKVDGSPSFFDTRNHFFLENFQLLLIKQGFEFIRVDMNQEVSDRRKVLANDNKGNKYLISSDEIQAHKRPKAFDTSNPYTIENIEKWCMKNRPDYGLCEGQSYTNARTSLKWFYKGVLPKGYSPKFNMSLDNFKNKGKEHPAISTSRAERMIAKVLSQLQIPYKTQVRLEDCKFKLPLPFDFVIFMDFEDISLHVNRSKFQSIQLLIEYNGIHHKKPIYGEESLKLTQKRDKIKKDFCKSKDLDLIIMDETPHEKIKEEIIKQLASNGVRQFNNVNVAEILPRLFKDEA